MEKSLTLNVLIRYQFLRREIQTELELIFWNSRYRFIIYYCIFLESILLKHNFLYKSDAYHILGVLNIDENN